MGLRARARVWHWLDGWPLDALDGSPALSGSDSRPVKCSRLGSLPRVTRVRFRSLFFSTAHPRQRIFHSMLGRRPTYHLETLRLLRAVEAENASLKEELARSNGEIAMLRRSLSRLLLRAKSFIRRLSRQQPTRTRTRRRLAV